MVVQRRKVDEGGGDHNEIRDFIGVSVFRCIGEWDDLVA